jgi:hypothetical protein
MKKLIALLLAVAVFAPTLAFAGASTDAALGLGAFAVFNQFLGGVGIFHRGPVVVPAPVVVARPAPVYVPAPVVVARPYPLYVPAPRPVLVRERGFCPPGHLRHGWCYPAPVYPGWRY